MTELLLKLMVKVLIKRLDKAVKLPEYKSDGASGIDLMAFVKDSIKVKPQTSTLIPTGISLAFSIMRFKLDLDLDWPLEIISVF